MNRRTRLLRFGCLRFHRLVLTFDAIITNSFIETGGTVFFAALVTRLHAVVTTVVVTGFAGRDTFGAKAIGTRVTADAAISAQFGFTFTTATGFIGINRVTAGFAANAIPVFQLHVGR